MAKSDGSVIIDTRMDTKGFGKGVHSMQKKVGGLTGAVGKLGLAIGAAFSVVKLVQFGKEAIDLGSDLQEVQNVVDVTFTTMNEAVNEFARNAAETAGLSETMAKRYTGTFGAMAKAFGFAEEQSFQMSTALTQLAGDVASFYNLTQDEAYTKLKSVFTGETETLKDLGVVMTQSALDAFAMAEGYGKTTKAMSEQEKVALRFAFVTKQLNAASGDFIRTQDSWANMTRILSLNFDSFKANIGQALINIFTPFLKVINKIVAKMAELSSSFVAFSEMIFGKSISGGGGSPPTEVLGDITEGYEDVESAATGAKKAQDKYLTGLDEIRTFTESTDNEAAAVGGGIDLSNVAESKADFEGTETAMSALVERMKELENLFKEGFAEGLGDTERRLQSLKNSVESIKDSFAYIFDADLAEGFNNALNRVVCSIGVIAGSFASIGLTLATNLVGGFSKYLEQNKSNIKNYLLGMFDIGASMWEKAGELTSTLAYIFEEFASETGQQLTANILTIISDIFMEITYLASQLGLDILTLITDPIKNSKEELRVAFSEIIAGYEEFTKSVSQILEDSFVFINKLYIKNIAPIFETLILELEVFYKEHIVPMMSTMGQFFSSLADNLMAFWNKTLKPFIQWVSENILPVAAPIFEAVGKKAMNLFSMLTDISQGLIQAFDGLITFLTGRFTGDWERAWSGIKDIFSGIINSCIAVIERFVNDAIDMINGVIESFNELSSKTKKKSSSSKSLFNINIPTIPEFNIPKLATGTVIPPNAPFMAVLGDQRHGTNIEAPLDTIKQAVREVVGNGNGGVLHAHLYLDGKEVLTSIIDMAKMEQMATGINPLQLT